jgi:hypothetical protein
VVAVPSGPSWTPPHNKRIKKKIRFCSSRSYIKNSKTDWSKFKSKSHCDWWSVSQSVSVGVERHLELMTRYLLLFGSYGLVSVGRPLWRENGSVFCICCCCSFSRVRVPWYSRPYFTVSDLRLPFSSPHTIRRVTVEVFDPHWLVSSKLDFYNLHADPIENTMSKG